MNDTTRLTLVLRAAVGQSLDKVIEHAQVGAHVSVGRGLAVIEALPNAGPAPGRMDEHHAKKFVDAVQEEINTLHAHIAHLQEQIAQQEPDVRRYQWLRDSKDSQGDDLRLYLIQEHSTTSLDAEVDAAMAADEAQS